LKNKSFFICFFEIVVVSLYSEIKYIKTKLKLEKLFSKLFRIEMKNKVNILELRQEQLLEQILLKRLVEVCT